MPSPTPLLPSKVDWRFLIGVFFFQWGLAARFIDKKHLLGAITAVWSPIIMCFIAKL